MNAGNLTAVFDTNVLLSGLVGRSKLSSTPGELFRRWLAEEFELIVSDFILAEVARASSYPYFVQQSPARRRRALLHRLETRATLVELPYSVAGVAPDSDDDSILATALSAAADYPVTGDRGLLQMHEFEGVAIVTPRSFLDVLVARS